MNPCNHFTAHSSVTGLDSEGVCLTCKTPWSLEDVSRAVKRATSSVTITCTLCGDGGKYSAEDVYVLTNHLGAVLVHECRTCRNTVHTPVVPEAVNLLESAAVMFTTDLNPITAREVKKFEITLYAVDDLARLAGMAS
jgi:dihydroxyacetone kinase